MKTLIKYLVLAASLAALSVSARADLWLVLYDAVSGATTQISATNTGTGSFLSFSGAVGTTGTVASSGGINSNVANGAATSWVVNVSAGILVKNGASPQIDLSSVNFSSGAGDLYIGFGADGLGPTPGPASVNVAIGGTTTGQVYYSAYVDPTNLSNGYPGGGILLSPVAWEGPMGPGAFSDTVNYALPPLAGLYSMSNVVEIIHTAGGVTSFDKHDTVPDSGMTALLLGFGLVGVGLAARRFKA